MKFTDRIGYIFHTTGSGLVRIGMAKQGFPILVSMLLAFQSHAAIKILSIRGGQNTGGFLEGGSDEQLSSFLDYTKAGGNHSWGEFADMLKTNGFEITEIREGSNQQGCDASKNLPCSTPVNLDSIGLDKFDIVIFGSNNSRYSSKAVGGLLRFIDEGGGAVFISDGNFGRNWGDAPSSDQGFLDSVGWTMNQDGGTYAVAKSNGKFVVPEHEILKSVNSFDGEGVSPITVTKSDFNGFTSTILALANGDVHRNTNYGGGSNSPATSRDASLCLATRNRGRIVGHFDRNTFFNANGAGTNLGRFDNKALGLNLLRWVGSGRVGTAIVIQPLPGKTASIAYPFARNGSGFPDRSFVILSNGVFDFTGRKSAQVREMFPAESEN